MSRSLLHLDVGPPRGTYPVSWGTSAKAAEPARVPARMSACADLPPPSRRSAPASRRPATVGSPVGAAPAVGRPRVVPLALPGRHGGCVAAPGARGRRARRQRVGGAHPVPHACRARRTWPRGAAPRGVRRDQRAHLRPRRVGSARRVVLVARRAAHRDRSASPARCSRCRTAGRRRRTRSPPPPTVRGTATAPRAAGLEPTATARRRTATSSTRSGHGCPSTR